VQICVEESRAEVGQRFCELNWTEKKTAETVEEHYNQSNIASSTVWCV
jgi:hypothetical protein